MSEPCHKTAVPSHLDGVDRVSSDVFHALLRTIRSHRRLMMQTLADQGMHPGQAMVLRLLGPNDDIIQRDLAEALHVTRPTVTKMLHSMEKAGLVRRHPDRDDQRLTRVRLTAAGRAEEKRMRAAAADYVNATIATLAQGDRRALARLLDKLSAGIDRAAAARTADLAADLAADLVDDAPTRHRAAPHEQGGTAGEAETLS